MMMMKTAGVHIIFHQFYSHEKSNTAGGRRRLRVMRKIGLANIDEEGGLRNVERNRRLSNGVSEGDNEATSYLK